MSDDLNALVREKWASVLNAGFDVTGERPEVLTLESSNVRVVVAHDPRGEVDVRVYPLDRERWDGWSYTGFVGRASVGRLLELALAEMQAEPAILRGDAEFYARLATENLADRQAWTEYYARRGPRPGRRKLP